MAFLAEKAVDHDYVLKADDDAFVFVGNLRALLQPFDPNDRLYLGHDLYSGHNWMSGFAYVISRGGFVAAMDAFPEIKAAAAPPSLVTGGDIFAKRRRRLLTDDQPEDSAIGIVMTAVRAA